MGAAADGVAEVVGGVPVGAGMDEAQIADHNRAKAQLAARLGATVGDITKCWMASASNAATNVARPLRRSAEPRAST